jgi:benzoate-CoA ligase
MHNNAYFFIIKTEEAILNFTAPAGPYNLAADLIDRHSGVRAAKIAYATASDATTYAELARKVKAAGTGLLDLGLARGDRVLLCMVDGVDFVIAFLGAIHAGLLPIAINTLAPSEDYAYVLKDSDPRAVIVSASVFQRMRDAVSAADWNGHVFTSGGDANAPVFGSLLQNETARPPALTDAADNAFWLYSSGSTGRPKGTPHRHASLIATAHLFGQATLGLHSDDVIYSAAKLFFAYGLGNSLTFPLAVGANVILNPDRVTPQSTASIIADNRVSVFFGGPTLFNALLALPDLEKFTPTLRLCVSAGEALSEAIGLEWKRRTGIDIIDGIGSTEMLHIFLSNRPGCVRPGTTGRPVPGYEVRLLDDEGNEAGIGVVGDLYVTGPSITPGYWNQPEKTAASFSEGWMKRNDEGDYTHCGRSDDMLKVSGQWVSPTEVEGALLAHPAVAEAAIIGIQDANSLMRTKAFVVLKSGFSADDQTSLELQNFVKSRLTPHKYPREIAFVSELPKTATGKIQRFKLRLAES